MAEAVNAMNVHPSRKYRPPTAVVSSIISGEHSNLYDIHITRRAQEPIDVVCISHLVDEHEPSFEVDRIFFPSVSTDIGIGARLVDPAAWNGVLTVTAVHREHNMIILWAAYLHQMVILTIDVGNRTIFKHVDALNVKVNNEFLFPTPVFIGPPTSQKKLYIINGGKVPSWAELVAHLIRRSDHQALDRNGIYDALLAMFPWILEHRTEAHWKESSAARRVPSKGHEKASTRRQLRLERSGAPQLDNWPEEESAAPAISAVSKPTFDRLKTPDTTTGPAATTNNHESTDDAWQFGQAAEAATTTMVVVKDGGRGSQHGGGFERGRDRGDDRSRNNDGFEREREHDIGYREGLVERSGGEFGVGDLEVWVISERRQCRCGWK
ncbi:hypothetical protein B0H16DRAFT_1714055 [Mycena metata]|uniref:Uncharacterized protein n=1 Tax=Mycena metata TaxID=1033252 RepID=A0AAD7NSC9_9AGAR|nr:hypothetical protein B0H16DRAFT_1714055 [Mycena metata]